MRALERNRTAFAYAKYLRSEDLRDADGNRTGAAKQVFGAPVEAKANISAGRGEADFAVFGMMTQYDRTICWCGDGIDLAEGDAVWIGIATNLPHNYIVVRVAQSLNSTLAAVSEVNLT